MSAINPHCEPQWPDNCGTHPAVAGLRQALYGAQGVAGLLLADAAIADRYREATDKEREALPVPLSSYTSGALHAALHACLGSMSERVEFLEECRIHRAGGVP